MSERLPGYPEEIEAALSRAVRLEWWSLAWLSLIVLAMGLAAGGSQAFRTAWIEDMLSLLPPIFFLISWKLESLPARAGFPFGFHRAGSLAFFFSASALAIMGAILLLDGAITLAKAEHPTVGSLTLFGREVWQGWLMIGALAFSTIAPVILGHRKRQVAEALRDKVLYTDAQMNAADWRTGAAGVVGVLGIAFGVWWADAVMAILISLSILYDGVRGLSTSMISLLDGAPRKLESMEIDEEAQRLVASLRQRYRDACVQVRESGRYFRVSVEPAAAHPLPDRIAAALMRAHHWRLLEVSLALRDRLPEEGEEAEPKV